MQSKVQTQMSQESQSSYKLKALIDTEDRTEKKILEKELWKEFKRLKTKI